METEMLNSMVDEKMASSSCLLMKQIVNVKENKIIDNEIPLNLENSTENGS